MKRYVLTPNSDDVGKGLKTNAITHTCRTVYTDALSADTLTRAQLLVIIRSPCFCNYVDSVVQIIVTYNFESLTTHTVIGDRHHNNHNHNHNRGLVVVVHLLTGLSI